MLEFIGIHLLKSPLEVSRRIIDEYRKRLQFTLESNGLSASSIETILESFESDSDVYFSLNPSYERSTKSFNSFVYKHDLPYQLLNFNNQPDFTLFRHQERGILSILEGNHTVISTGTGSGKTETFLIPILAYCLRSKTPGIKAILIYPMNALAGDQVERIRNTGLPVKAEVYTGATTQEERRRIRQNPPDILITNYVMLDRMLMRKTDAPLFELSSLSMRYVVLDELHMYNGSSAAHLKYLLTRLDHRIENRITYVGTSATLTSETAEKAQLDKFLQHLWNIQFGDYEFIEAREEHQNSVDVEELPILTVDDLAGINFKDEVAAAKSLEILLNDKFDPSEFYASSQEFQQNHIYQAMLRNQYVAAIYNFLKQGAQSSDDLVRAVASVMPVEQFNLAQPEQIFNAYYGAIAYLNQTAGVTSQMSLIDHRVHIFIQRLTGQLKMCPSCGQYFGGSVKHCPQDRHTLFAVFRDDIRFCIAKVNGQDFRPTLEPESTDVAKTHYVIIGRASDELPANFLISGNLNERGEFTPDIDGRFRLAPLDARNFSQVKSQLVTLADDNQQYRYLIYLSNILAQIGQKCLAFVDNRENASRYSSILRDEFANEFLIEFLRLVYPVSPLGIEQTLDLLITKAQLLSELELEKEIFAELPTWFYRFIHRSIREGGDPDLLQLNEECFEPLSLSELEHELLQIFISERAICTDAGDYGDGNNYIRFQTYRATHHYGIYIEDTISAEPAYRGVVLNDKSQIYADFVETWTVSVILTAINSLVSKGIVIHRTTPDSKSIYYLDPSFILISVPRSQFGSQDEYDELRKQRLFTAALHSSDVSTVDRPLIEAKFKSDEAKLAILFATSTLEVGIDIGDLNCVLMVGAPPSPANYVQRAGRAGRGKKRDAVIITFCDVESTHDAYAFRNPRAIVNGIVAPPHFNRFDQDLVKKHVNAFLAAGRIGSERELDRFSADLDDIYTNYIPQIKQLFGETIDWHEYRTQFEESIVRLRNSGQAKDITPVERGYMYGIFPEYGFRQDEVVVVDIENEMEIDPTDPYKWKEYALTRRDPEQALTLFAPRQTLYASGDIYRLTEQGIYEELSDGARQYMLHYAERDSFFARQTKMHTIFDVSRALYLPEPPHLIAYGGIVEYSAGINGVLALRNRGEAKHEKSESKDQVTLGFDIHRNVFILRFDEAVCDEVLCNSFTSVIAREISHRFWLANGELQVAFNVEDGLNKSCKYVVFYENDGNGIIDMQRIASDFHEIVASAYQRLASCICSNDGCYRCIRSYETQFINETLSKKQATIFLGYLLGKNLFIPNFKPFSLHQNEDELVLQISLESDLLTVTSNLGHNYKDQFHVHSNATLFGLVTKAIYSEFQPSMRSLRITTGRSFSWLKDAINNRSIKKDIDIFNHFQFALLKFESVRAE